MSDRKWKFIIPALNLVWQEHAEAMKKAGLKMWEA
jgi:hypothetical protein